METQVMLPEGEPPISIREVVLALKDQKLKPRHERKDWGDWILFSGQESVVSIESQRGLAASATIEQAEGEEEWSIAVLAAFRALGWEGVDEDGRYRL